jgi:uncharacterized membrane protein (DUF373 family)
MSLNEQLAEARKQWRFLTLYGKFEHMVILIVTALIAVVVFMAVCSLAWKIFFGMILAGTVDFTDYATFQIVFGMIFTVIIALEFKRSLLVVAGRHYSVVHVRTVVLIALLAIVRKVLILDLSTADAMQLFAIASAILALGTVYWLVRDQDMRETLEETHSSRTVSDFTSPHTPDPSPSS